MKKVFYPTLAGIMALAAATNNLAPAAPAIAANAMPAPAPAVTTCCLANSMGGTGNYVMTTSYAMCTTCVTEPVIVFDSWQDVYRDAHFRYASEYSDYSDCVVREVLDDAKNINIPYYFDIGDDYNRVSRDVVGVEYDGTAVKTGEGVRQRELVLDKHISFLTLYDFSADENAVDNPENYYDLFTSLVILNPKCSIDIPQIDAIVKLLHKNGLELTIHGLEGSTAEQYAKKHGLPFENAMKTDGEFTFCMHADHVSVYKWENDNPEDGSIDVTIPAEVNGLPVTEIDDNAFSSQYSIRAVNIPDTVTRIGENAFWFCKNLQTVHIPASLCEIGKAAFQNTKIESVELPDSVTEIGKFVFRDCSSLKSVRLPDGLKTIPGYLFYQAENLREVTIPDSVTAIGSEAFSACKQLKTLVLPEHLDEIGAFAFYDSALSAIEIPDSVTQIGASAFEECVHLESIRIPDGVTTLCGSTFCHCDALERAELPEGLRSIGSYAFAYSKIQSIDIPDSCKDIRRCAFERCENLESVRLPKDLRQLGESTFHGCTALKTVQLPQKLEIVEQGVFAGCSALEFLAFPDTVIAIDSGAMSGCTSLKTVRLSEQLEEIPDSLFDCCTALKEIEIPASVESIGRNVFDGCTSLAAVTILSKDCEFDSQPFGASPASDLTLIGYPDSTTQQAAEDNFILFKSLDGNSIITPDPVNALIFEKRSDGAWLTGLKVGMSDVTVPAEYEGVPVVGIADEACYGMEIKHLVLPDTVKTIGESAFDGCKLETVKLPKNLQTIGKCAFVWCDLESVVIPDSVTVLPWGVFGDCKKLTDVTLPAHLTTIEGAAFLDTNLTSVTLPASVNFIGEDAFSNCPNLTAITIPNGDCTVEDFLSQSYIEQQQDMERPVPKLYGVKDSAVHGYADWLGIPFCTLDGTPVTEPSAVTYQPRVYWWETTPYEPEETDIHTTGTYICDLTTAATTASVYDFVAGDINQNGSLTVSDAILLARVLAEDTTITVTEKGIRNADMNNSGAPDAEDLTLILKRLANIK